MAKDANHPPHKTISAFINGKELEFSAGMTVLQAAVSMGADVPTLCDDERIRPCGSCRVCLVEVKGQPRAAASCSTALAAEMEIETDTAALNEARKMNLRMLARSYPAGPFRDFPDKPFHRLARRYGLDESDFMGEADPALIDDSHPYIHVDMSQCIDCYRCVRICEELPGRFVWQIMNRGGSTHVVPDSRTNLLDSSCISCGACVETCPTGALEDKSVLEFGVPTKWTKTTCPYCGVGCEMNVGTDVRQKIVQIKPAESPVNREHLCVKGRYAFAFSDAKDRITEPMIRRDGEWTPVTWDEALEYTATKLSEVIAQNGEDSVAVLGSARATNEENYLAQKFARTCIGTNNVDCCARVCHTPSAAALKMVYGTGAATNSFADIELANAILVCGANPTESHPIIGERIIQAVLRRGTKLVVIDPRRTEIANRADVHLQLRPGTNIPLLNSLASVIIEEGLVDESFLAERVLEFDKFRDFVAEYSPEKVAGICGVAPEDIRRAGRIYAAGKPSMCFHGLGVTEHMQGTEGVMAVANLTLLTGNVGIHGSGENPLRGQNNVQGAAHMGCDPGVLTGSIGLEDGRPVFERVWNTAIPTSKGLNAMEMIDAAGDGRLKALWTIGFDIFFTNPKSADTATALDSLELIIIQDMFLNETAKRFGHVFFPAASSFEKDGTFMNAERRVQRVRKAVEPRGNSKSDWEIIRDLARAMGKGDLFNYGSAEEIWDEVRTVWGGSAGISYRNIEDAGLQWPCTSEDAGGTDILHTDEFSLGKRTSLRRIKYRPTPEVVTDEFPFLLNTGRTRYSFNSGTMTGRTNNIELRPTDLVSVNPADAERLLLLGGERVRLTSRYGEAELPASIDSSVREGELFATFHDPKVFLNRLTSPHRDRFVGSPEYKVTAVRIEKLMLA